MNTGPQSSANWFAKIIDEEAARDKQLEQELQAYFAYLKIEIAKTDQDLNTTRVYMKALVNEDNGWEKEEIASVNIISSSKIVYKNKGQISLIKSLSIERFPEGEFEIVVNTQSLQTDEVAHRQLSNNYLSAIQEQRRLRQWKGLDQKFQYVNEIDALDKKLTMQIEEYRKTLLLLAKRDLTISNKIRQKSLTHEILRNACWPPLENHSTRGHTFRGSHLGLIKNFLNVVVEVEPLCLEIEQEIFSLVGLEPNQSYEIPLWIKDGNFNVDLSPSSQQAFTRKVQYYSTDPDSPIKMIRLTKNYRSIAGSLTLFPKDEFTYRALKEKSQQVAPDSHINLDYGPDLYWSGSRVLATFFHEPELISYLDMLLQDVPGVELIKQEIVDLFERAIAEDPVDLSESESESEEISENVINESFEAARDHQHQLSIPKPDCGENQQIVEKLGISENIPDKFICAITQYVMNTPTFDPNTPNIKFDKQQILYWLALNEVNPFNRRPLKPEQLVVDSVLADEITDFIASHKKPIIHQFRGISTKEVTTLMNEANRFIGEGLPKKRKRMVQYP